MSDGVESDTYLLLIFVTFIKMPYVNVHKHTTKYQTWPTDREMYIYISVM